MAYITLVTNVKSPARVAEGQAYNARGSRDGVLFTQDYLLALALEGRILQARTGVAATPATFAVGYTNTQPSLEVDVPSGTAIIPIHMSVHLQTSAGTINEIVAVTSTTLIGAGTSTAVTQLSTRSDAPFTSACTVRSLYSGAGTAPTLGVELWHTGYAFADTSLGPVKTFDWDIRNSPGPAAVVGAGALALYVFATTTAPTGYALITWAEIPTSSIN